MSTFHRSYIIIAPINFFAHPTWDVTELAFTIFKQKFMFLQQIGEGDITDSSSCPMLITCDRDGEADILGIRREMSATDDSLIRSSSTNEFDGISCNIGNGQNCFKSYFDYCYGSTYKLNLSWYRRTNKMSFTV